jgi:DNA-binding HxlR family transcriptional regulator
MKRKSLDTANCPIARTLDVIGDWWSLLIVRDAFLGKRRFSEFQKSLGLAKNILCVRLQKLVSHGVLTTAPASDGSAYQEYRLTEKGRSLYLVLVALRQWGERNLFDKGELDLLLVDRQTGKPVKALELRSQDGRLLGPADLRTI